MESLWEMSDKMKAESEEERRKVVRNGWMEDHLTMLLNSHITLMQLEVDRYLECRQILKDFFRAKRGLPLEEPLKPVDLPFVGSSLKFLPPAKASAAKGKKKVRMVPGTSVGGRTNKKEDHFLELSITLEKALSIVPPKDDEEEKKEPQNAELDKALELEDEIARRRFRRIRDRGVTLLNELKQKSDTLYSKMDDWIGEKFKKEVNNTEKMILFVKDVIEKETKLPQLQLNNNELVVEEEESVETDNRHKEDSEKEMKWQSKQNQLNSLQLIRMIQKLSVAAPSGIISSSDFVELLQTLAASSNEFGTEVDLPLQWLSLDRNQLAELIQPFSVQVEEDSLNWMNFLVGFYSKDEKFSLLQEDKTVPPQIKEALQRLS